MMTATVFILERP